jgi:hypothetical protein
MGAGDTLILVSVVHRRYSKSSPHGLNGLRKDLRRGRSCRG